MKCAEALAKYLEYLGVKTAFGISGGAIIHFVDALHSNSQIRLIFNSNEMFSAFAADGISRSKTGIGLCFGTSGPGMTNLITGISSSYYDSVPTIVVTGQDLLKRIQTLESIWIPRS